MKLAMRKALLPVITASIIVSLVLAGVPAGADDEVDLTATVVSHGPPVLHFGAVDPEAGFADTDFTYSVEYTDADNDVPTLMVVYIDGVAHDMTPLPDQDGDYINGETYEFVASGLEKDVEHTYRFAASDAGDGTPNATDDIEEHAGPVVENKPPSVESVSISPDPAFTDSDLTGIPAGWYDPDVADAPSYQWQWQKEGNSWDNIPDATTATLDNSNFQMGDQVKVICTPFDGTVTGAAVEATITISGAPEAEITSPPDGDSTTSATITVAGTAIATPALTHATLTVNGVSRNINVTNGDFSEANVPLAKGANTISVSVSNIVGTDSDTITVTRNSVPVVRITSPSNGAIFQDATVQITGTVNAFPAVGEVTIIVNEGEDCEAQTTATVTNGRFTQNVDLPVEGQNTVRASATNDAGTGTSSTVTVTLNSQAPAVTIVAPVSGLETNSSVVNVSGTVIDDPPLDQATLTVNGVSRTIGVAGDTFQEPVTLLQGSNTIKVTATDGLNTGSAMVTVILDTTPPVVSITSPPNNYITSSDTIDITGTVSDTDITEATLTLNNAGGTTIIIMPLTGGSFSRQVALQNGRNTVSVSATDSAGNTGTSGSILITYDNTKPTVTITSPPSDHITGTAQLTVTGTVVSANPLTSSNLLLNGTAVPVTVTAGRFSKTVTLSPGVNTIEVRVDDSATPPNTGSSGIITVTLDKTAPVITINRPRDGLLLGTASVTIAGTIDDLAVTQATLKLNGAASQIGVTEGAFSVDRNLVEGTNTILVTATDAYGNRGTSGTVVIKVDTTKPTVTVNTPPTNLVTNATTIPVSGVVEHSQTIDGMALTLNGVVRPIDFWETASWEFGTTITLARGVNTIVVRATDALDHTGSSGVIYVTRDDIPPTIELTSPVNGSFTNDANLTVTGTIDDPRVTTATLRVNGTPEVIPVQGGQFSRSVIINPGANTVRVSAIDGAGNTGNSPLVTVTLDTTKPKVTITSPEEGHRTNDASLDVFTEVTHNKPVESVTLSLNGGAALEMTLTGDTYVGNVSLSPANDGLNTIEAVATDDLGNVGRSGEITVTLDTTRPQLVVSLSDPTDTVLITVASNESLRGAPEVDINGPVDMTLIETNKWTGKYPATGILPEGSYVVTVTATDRAGNQSTRTATFCKETVSTDNQETQVSTETTTVEVHTDNDVNNATLTVTQHIGNPTENTETGEAEAGVFVEVVASGELRDSVDWVRIEVSYDPAEMEARGIDENTLKLYLWNVETGQWEVVEDSGVDTVNHIIWGNVDHLSTFGGFGAPLPAPTTGGGGGGGGGEPPPGTVFLFDIITSSGMFTAGVVATSDDGTCTITIPRRTVCLKPNGNPPYKLTILESEWPPAAPVNSSIVGKVYDLGPDGITFEPPVFLTLAYDINSLPQGASENNLVIAYWDAESGKWVVLEGCSVDTVSHTVTAPISHFTEFAILVYTRPAAFTVSDLTVTPSQVDIGEEVTASFIVSNTGDLSDIYQAVLEVNGVVTATREIGLSGGFSQRVTFPIVADAPGSYTVSVDVLSGTFEVMAPAAFTVSDLTVTPSQVDIGEEVTVSAIVSNTGDVTGDYKLVLRVNNVVTASREITLPGGASRPVTFTTMRGVPGSYTVSVDVLSGTFEVRAPAAFTVSDLTVTPSQVDIGEEVTVSVIVSNTGDVTGSYEIDLNINGAAIDTETITLAGGAEQTVTFTTTGDTPGDYTVTVAGMSGAFEVRAPAAEARAINWALIGSIIGAAIILGLLIYFLAFRRRYS